MTEWRKAIPESRDRLQSKILVGTVVSVLLASALYSVGSYLFYIVRLINRLQVRHFESPNLRPGAVQHLLTPVIVSLTFGLLVWRTKAATRGGILCGMLICYSAIPFYLQFSQLAQSGIVPIVALFLLTFAATRAGRQRKIALGLAEDRHGRNAAQVIANLGLAALVLGTRWEYFVDDHIGPTPWINHPWFEPALWAGMSMFIAALCEATADTVSSEIGQAFGGTPFLLTTLRRVPPGTDGAITLVGTAVGILAAILVALTGIWPLSLRWSDVLRGLAGGIAGLFFDSLLGATVERKGWLGNDLVNFFSTTFAVLVSLLLWLVLR